MFRVLGIGIENQDALLLFDAGEIKKVGIDHQRQRTIGIGGRQVVGVDDGQ